MATNSARRESPAPISDNGGTTEGSVGDPGHPSSEPASPSLATRRGNSPVTRRVGPPRAPQPPSEGPPGPLGSCSRSPQKHSLPAKLPPLEPKGASIQVLT